MNQTVRIIGGRFRGKKLSFLNTEDLRPTPDRVRETLFNWLMHDIRDARCLDAFAGSGALGFEAYSRGASSVTLLEVAPRVYNHLLEIATSFASPVLNVIQTDARLFLRQSTQLFDIIFLDPPFKETYLPETIALIERSNQLVENGLLYLESPELVELNPDIWKRLKSKQAGQVVYQLYRKIN